MWMWRKFWDMKYKMWVHWCPVEHTTMNVGNGEECNWCGQDEEYESRNRRYRNRFSTTNINPLYSSKGSSDITDTSVGSLTGHIRVDINGTDFWIPYYATN